MVCVPTGLTAVERRAVLDVARAAGAAEVRRWIARSVITTVVCGTLWFLGQAVWSVLRQKLGN